jgi:hypothetical protein
MNALAFMSSVLEFHPKARCKMVGCKAVVMSNGQVIGRGGSYTGAWRDASIRLNALTMNEQYLLGMVQRATSFEELKHRVLFDLTLAVVRSCNGNQVKAAERMGTHRNTVSRILKLRSKDADLETFEQVENKNGHKDGHQLESGYLEPNSRLLAYGGHHQRKKRERSAMSILLCGPRRLKPEIVGAGQRLRGLGGAPEQGATVDGSSELRRKPPGRSVEVEEAQDHLRKQHG